MKNLKRLLSLALTLAMMVGFFATSASAAFKDQADIDTKHEEAVNMNVALNIINGYDDGTFKPLGNVTRGEMAKMVTIVMNRGTDPNLSTQATPSYTDTASHWAHKYIEYCTDLGIVAGHGNGTFKPDDTVTATEAAKMLLVCLGFDANIEKFNGPTWLTSINRVANERGLYEELKDIEANAPLTREHAAQMIYNALEATEVVYQYISSGDKTSAKAIDRVDSNDNKITLMIDKFGTADTIGVMTAYEWVEKDAKFKYDIDVNGASVTFKSAEDYSDLFAMNVKVIEKQSDGSVYGMFAEDSVILASGSVIDLEDSAANEIKFAGDKYKTEAAVANLAAMTAYPENQYAAPVTGTATLAPYYEARLIDLDGNDKVDYVVFMPFEIGKVTSVGTKNVGVSTITANAIPAISLEDDTVYEGVAKDDYVKYIAPANTAYEGKELVLVESFDGFVDSTVAAAAPAPAEATIDGTDYYIYTTSPAISVKAGNEYTFFSVGSFVFAADLAAGATLENLLFVKAVDPGTITTQAEVYFTDGSSEVIVVGDVKLSDGTKQGAASAAALTLYTYSEDNGKYILTVVDDTNNLGFTKSDLTATGLTDSKLTGGANTYVFDDAATLFVYYNEAAAGSAPSYVVKVITGEQAKKLADMGLNTSNPSQVLYDSNGAVHTVGAGALLLDGSGDVTGDATYGVVLAAVADSTVGGNAAGRVTIWNGTEKINVFDTNLSAATAGGIVPGAVVEYKLADEATMKGSVTVKTSGPNGGVIASRGVSGDQFFYSAAGTAADASITMADDITVLYTDSSAKSGSDAGTLDVLADEVTAGAGAPYTTNAWMITNTAGDEAIVIVIDTNNKWDWS